MMKAFLNRLSDEDHVNPDISREMLKYSSYRNICERTEMLRFRDESFEPVVLPEVLEHIDNKTKTLRGCKRVLKRGGLLLLSTPRTGWTSDFWRGPFLPLLLAYALRKRIRGMEPPVQVPSGVRDQPSDEKWFRSLLERLDYGHRSDSEKTIMFLGRATRVAESFGCGFQTVSRTPGSAVNVLL